MRFVATILPIVIWKADVDLCGFDIGALWFL